MLDLDNETKEWCLWETLRRDPCLFPHLNQAGFTPKEAQEIAHWVHSGGPKVGEETLWFIQTMYIPTRRIQIRRKVPNIIRDPLCPATSRVDSDAFTEAMALSLFVTVPYYDT